jgi:hypothetical protein
MTTFIIHAGILTMITGARGAVLHLKRMEVARRAIDKTTLPTVRLNPAISNGIKEATLIREIKILVRMDLAAKIKIRVREIVAP